MLVFDIDETVLSNLGPMRARSYAPQSGSVNARPLLQASGEPDANGTRVQHVGAATSDQDLSPALGAIRDVYLAAYQYGLSVSLLPDAGACTVCAGEVCMSDVLTRSLQRA